MKYSSSYTTHQKSDFTKPSPLILHTRTSIFLQKIDTIIHTNIENEEFSVTVLAMKIHLSVSQLNRKLNSSIGQPAGQLIRSIRMKHASKLLANDVAPIGEIAYRVGYMNHTHFCRSFKREYGCSPSQYSKKHTSTKH